ncbi:MAG: ABC transporter substrate-binding protein [Clostridia bacterium]|nr:ABC transporter substrate-binding protein [Clostridia bacterium]
MNKRWCRGLSLLLAAVLLLAGCVGCKKKDNGLDTVRVCEVTHSIFYAPQYAAIALGFFEEEGIEIELSNGQGADAVMAAVLSGNIDVGFAGPEASIYVYNEGKKDHTQVFAQVTRRDGSFLIGREPDDNFTWDKVKGKTVLPGRKGGVPYMALEYVLRQNGIDPYEDTNLDNSVQFSMMTAAFTGGTGDYVTAFEPTASMLQQEGKGYIVASVGEAAGDIPYTAYFAKKSYIDKNSDLIQRFTNAVYKGQQWVATHTDAEVAQAVAEFFPDTSLELLTASVASYRAIDAWNTDPVMSEESFNRLQTVMTEAGELTKTADYDKVVNNTFANKAKG